LLIDGPSGAGKTSIVEGIIWCLYGKARLENRSLVKLGKQTGRVELALTDGKFTWIIRRTVTKKGSQTLDISLEDSDRKARAVGATSLKEKQAYIEKEILKSSYELFINSVAYPQNSTSSFVNQTASRRKELLLEIVGAGNFDEYLEKAKDVLARLENETNSAKVEAETLATMIMTEKNDVDLFGKIVFDPVAHQKKILEKDDLIIGTNGAISVLKMTIDTVVSKIASAKAAAAERDSITKELASIVPIDLKPMMRELQSLEWAIGEIAKEKGEYDELFVQKEIIAKASARRSILELELEKLPIKIYDDQIKSANKRLIELLSSPGNLCPNTNKVCVKAQAMVDARQKELESELNQATSSFNLYKVREAEIRREIESTPVPVFDEERFNNLKIHFEEERQMSIRRAEILGVIEVAKKTEERRAALSRRLTELPIGDIGVDENELSKKRNELVSAENLLAQLRETKSKLEYELALWKEKTRDIEVKKAKIGNTEKRIAELKESSENKIVDIENVQTVKTALGPNGIKVVIVDTILPRLEQRINDILAELSEFRVKLDTQRVSASDEDKKVEGLFISIINDQGEELDYEGYSGGERLKIIVAISEALAELQKTQFRLVDELFVGLDTDSITRFGEILLKLQERFSQVIAISHIPEIKTLFDDKITVTKKDGTSVVV